MNNYLSIILFSFFVTSAFAQEPVRQVKKEVQLEEENGIKTLTIKTLENGEEKVEVFEGAEADKKLEELGGVTNSEKIKKEVKLVNENGKKKLTITTTNNGVVSEEVFVGKEAEEKLKEIEEHPENKLIKKEKKIILE